MRTINQRLQDLIRNMRGNINSYGYCLKVNCTDCKECSSNLNCRYAYRGGPHGLAFTFSQKSTPPGPWRVIYFSQGRRACKQKNKFSPRPGAEDNRFSGFNSSGLKLGLKMGVRITQNFNITESKFEKHTKKV